MAKAQSVDKPQKIKIVRLDNQQVKLRLIDNIIETEKIIDDVKKTVYEYDEVVYITSYTDTIEQSVVDNFEMFYRVGQIKEKQEQKEKILKKLAKLDKEVSRVEEDIIEKMNVDIHDSKKEIIAKKKALRDELNLLNN